MVPSINSPRLCLFGVFREHSHKNNPVKISSHAHIKNRRSLEDMSIECVCSKHSLNQGMLDSDEKRIHHLLSDFLQTGTIHHVSDALLNHLGISCDEFQTSILGTETVTSGSFREQAYCNMKGTLFFQHPRSKHTTNLPFSSDAMLIEDVVYVCTKVTVAE